MVVLAAYVWTFWIGLALFIGALLAVVATVIGYVVKVQAPQYPSRKR